MARLVSKVKFPLKMKDGVAVRDMEGLRENFDLELAIGYAHSGKLVRWLRVWGMEQEADAVAALAEDAPDFAERLCHILGVGKAAAQELETETEDIIRQTEQKLRLKQLTAKPELIAKAGIAAFDDEDLNRLLAEGHKEILLCNASFTIPTNCPCKYTGVGKVEVIIKENVDLKTAGIELGRDISYKYEYEDKPVDIAQKSGQHNFGGTEKDLLAAADNGDIDAMCEVCERIGKRRALNVTYAEQVKIVSALHKAVNKEDDVQAMYGLSLVYEYGIGNCNPNEAAAHTWRERAKAHGCGKPSIEGHDNAFKYVDKDIAAMCELCKSIGLGTARIPYGEQIKVVSGLNLAANKGDAQAMYGMSLVYEYGIGNCNPNEVAAYTWRERAKAHGYDRPRQEQPKARADAPKMLSVDEIMAKAKACDESGDEVSARAWYEKAANMGCVDAMKELAFGLYCDDENDKAITWYQKAANTGDAEAMKRLGDIYKETGHITVAKTWFRKAADKGDAEAMNRLGLCFDEGNDKSQAVTWYKKSAKAGFDWGMYNYAVCLANGSGVGQNSAEAIRWFIKAADKGNTSAMCDLVTWWEADGTYNEDVIFNRLHQAVEDNEYDGAALYGLSSLYERGIGVSCDRNEALRLRLKAAERGNDEAKQKIEADSFEEFAYAIGRISGGYVLKDAKCFFSYDGSITEDVCKYSYLEKVAIYELICVLKDEGFFESCRIAVATDRIYVESFGKSDTWFGRHYVYSIDSTSDNEHIYARLKNDTVCDITVRSFNSVLLGCLLKVACGLKEQLTSKEHNVASRIHLKSRGGKTILENL